jgi:2,4-dienoyl-CoA reductase-like NADH-dependent reductase (Old Yellow Enzyme family)
MHRSSNAPFETLLSPFTVGPRQVKNRIAFPAIVSNTAVQNLITDRFLAFYGERAHGGAGMIITEALVVHPTSIAQPNVITLFDDRNDAGLRQLAERVETNDCRLLGQLWHIGRQQLWNPVASPVGVSDQPDAFSWTVPHVMDEDEIKDVRDGFIASAKRLSDAGFSGVELHGAHGYLIGQFLSPWSNVRTDAWGGDVVGRTRFVREIIAGIRAACRSDFIVGLKMPGDEGVKGGIDPDEAERLTKELIAHARADYIAYSQGNFSLSLEDHVPDMHYAPGPFIDIPKRMKAAAADVPVMAVGRIRNAEEGERVLLDGAGDLIAFGRALVADAALPRKLEAGQANTVRPCTFCNVCWGEIHAGKPIACIHNPWLGQPGEAAAPLPPISGRKKVVVVGGGVAGLEAAWVAATRGHHVVLFSHGEPGGALRLEADLPGRAEMAQVIGHQLLRARSAAIDIRRGERIDAAAIHAERPDVVLVATGARLRRPALAEQAHGSDLRSALAHFDAVARSGTAVLFDQDHSSPTYAAADLFAERFDRLVLVTPRVQLARGVPYVSGIGVYRRLYRAGVRIELAASPVSAPPGRVVIRNAFTGRETSIDDVSLFAWSTPRRADDRLIDQLKAQGVKTIAIGDARAPRTILAAIHEAHEVGAAI